MIENILAGYFNSPDVIVNPLLPLRDETDKYRIENYSNWYKVFEYCGSSRFKEALQFNDYIIVQIDTDTSEEANYDIPKYEGNKELLPEELIEKVVAKFESLIGMEFYAQYHERIIFAISVHSIECWLLPIYYTDKKKAKLKNCLGTLNQALIKKEGFSIDPNNKNPDYYERISRKYSRQKILMSLYEANPSLKVFVEEFRKRKITI
ncbi:MAG: phage tail protein [Blastocatellia bacterium]|nr:phage tail protein [Blastocatellia bacterium]